MNVLSNSDILAKLLISNSKEIPFFSKLVVGLSRQKMINNKDYFVMQSICLLDTIMSQKPIVSVVQQKYSFGSRSFTFGCKITLRRRVLTNFIYLFNVLFISELKKRHVSCETAVNLANLTNFSFAFNNVNVFGKLDEFYFKWNAPIIFTIAVSKSEFSLDYILFLINNE